MIDKLVVLAANARQFDIWRMENHVRREDAIYIDRADKLRGMTLRPFQVIRVGDYFYHPQIHEIERQLTLALSLAEAHK